MKRRPPRSTLFPYTTLSRAAWVGDPVADDVTAVVVPDLSGLAYRLLEELRRIREPLLVVTRSEEHTSELQSRQYLVCPLLLGKDRKCTHPKTCHADISQPQP